MPRTFVILDMLLMALIAAVPFNIALGVFFLFDDLDRGPRIAFTYAAFLAVVLWLVKPREKD